MSEQIYIVSYQTPTGRHRQIRFIHLAEAIKKAAKIRKQEGYVVFSPILRAA